MEASESAGSIWHHATTSMLDFIFHSAIRPIYWGNSYWIDVLRMQLYRCFCLLISNIKSSVYRSFHTYIRTFSYTHKQHHYFHSVVAFFFFFFFFFRAVLIQNERCDWSIDANHFQLYIFWVDFSFVCSVFFLFCVTFFFFLFILTTICVYACLCVYIFMLIHSIFFYVHVLNS